MTDEELIAALRTLGPSARLPGLLLYAEHAVLAAGIDPEHLLRLAAAHGGGRLEAGAVKLRKGQSPAQGRPGRPEGFIAVPESALG